MTSKKSRPLTKEEIEIVTEKQKIIKRELSLKKSKDNLKKRKEALQLKCKHPKDMIEHITDPFCNPDVNEFIRCNLCGAEI
jgi:hypothetical protein